MTTFSARSATLKVDKGHNPRLTSRGCAANIVHFWVFFLTQIHFEKQTWLKTVTNLKVSILGYHQNQTGKTGNIVL